MHVVSGNLSHISEDEPRCAEGPNDAQDGGNPHQRSQRLLKVDVVGFAVAGLGNGTVDIVRQHRSQDTKYSHDENPHQQFDLHRGIGDGKKDEAHKCHTGDAVGLEAVGRGSNAVASVVTRAVCNDTGVAGIVLANLEDHLHQVASDVGNLGEDTAGDTQGRSSEALTDGKADKAASSQILRHEEQDDKHQHQLDTYQHDTNRHAGAERYVQQVERTAAQRGKSHAGIGVSVHTHAEPGHSIAAQYSDHGPSENQRHSTATHVAQHSEIQRYGSADEDEQQQQKLALLLEIGGTGFEYDVAYFEHRFVGFQPTHLVELPEAEQQAEHHDGKSPVENRRIVRSGKSFRHFEVCFAGKSQKWRCQCEKGSC